MIPGCIRGPRSSQGSSTDDVSKQAKSIVQIYTEWANHYLEKSRSKKRINSLSTDCCDGVLLAEVIESVTSQRIPDVNRKPKTSSQMLDNINICLGVLQAQHVLGVENISAQELRDGKLKAILALFFALSRHKQAAKQRGGGQLQQPAHHQTVDIMTPNRSSAIPHKGAISSIPLPGSALPTRRGPPPDRGRSSQAGSSRSTSPAMSMIPRGAPSTVHPQNASISHQLNSSEKGSTSMLDKLRSFKQNNSHANSNGMVVMNGCGSGSGGGKRTSSSSGVSSGARSDSSAELSTNDIVHMKAVRNTSRLRPKAKGSPPRAQQQRSDIIVNSKCLSEKNTNGKVTRLAEPKIVLMASKGCGQDVPHKANVVGTGIPKPTAAVKGTTKQSQEEKTHQQNVSRENSQLGINVNKSTVVVMVSPLKNTQKVINDETKSTVNKTGTSTGTEIGEVDVNEKTKMNFVKEQLSSTMANQDDHETVTMNVEPMRPLLRGYGGSTLNLPSRPRYYPRVQLDGGSDYCEVTLANGYLSDGEILKTSPPSIPSSGGDLSDAGYMSEGGSALYNRRSHGLPLTNNNGCSRLIQTGLTVLTEQSSRRGRIDEATSMILASGIQQSPPSQPTAPPPPPPPPPPSSPQIQNARVSSSRSSRSSSHPSEYKHHHHHHHHGTHWKKYTDSPGVGSPHTTISASTDMSQTNASQQMGACPSTNAVIMSSAPVSPGNGRRSRKTSPHGSSTSSKESSKTKTRNGQQNFGYVKRANGVACNGSLEQQPQQLQAVQSQSGKTGAAVSAVPRTKVKVSGGTQTCSSDLQLPSTTQHKTNSAQYKSYSLTGNAATQLSQSVRERLMLGSQSLPKGAIQDYALILRHQNRPKASDGSLSDTQTIDNYNPYGPWLRHSNTYTVAPRLSETDSLESLTSLPSHRSSLTHARLIRDSPSRLSRSNSIRSTKSEKLYPSMLHRNNVEAETEPYYCLPVGALNHWSQPTSPAPANSRTFPLSPTHSANTTRHSGGHKNDDVHGSSVSLVSTASSLYSSAEEKQAHEIRKLRRELMEAHEKVQTLTSQLNTNAHVVSAFEQSLSSMTQRLQHLTATAEKKDTELAELRSAMDALRAQSIQAGIGNGLARQPSSDSVSSLSSACSLDKHEKDKKKKGWLRSSFTKAFSRSAKVTKVQCQSDTDHPDRHHPSLPVPRSIETSSSAPLAHTIVGNHSHIDPGQEVIELQKQLREKDLVLTDIRLEALSSAHQLENLKDTVMKMRSEMLSLKQNNERLQRIVNGGVHLPTDLHTTDTRTGSNSNVVDTLNNLMSHDELPPEVEPDGKRISITVYLGQPQTFDKYYKQHYESEYDNKCIGANATLETPIAHTNIGASTTWCQLDNAVRRAFKQHVARLDPGGGLGLGSDSIASYRLGEAERKPDFGPPDLLPVGYAVGRVSHVHVVLQPVAALAFEALIPKGVAQRLVSLLAEHRRLVLCGAAGMGKTHLATRLAEFHAHTQGRDPAEAVVTFNVANKSSKELRQYLNHLSEQVSNTNRSTNNADGTPPRQVPCVVVLDNLHKAAPLEDALGALSRSLPCLLGAMAQSACSATSLQLHHGFRWVLVAPHMEPARGLLGRVLRRKLAALELQHGPQPELAAILGWLPRVWQHLNAFLETHSSGDVAIGPRLFLSCPLELDASRAWFANIWNHSVAPYLRDSVRESVQLYGRQAPWTDPSQFVTESYPWPGAPPQGLAHITAKDVGLDSDPTSAENDVDRDPLLSMLLRLQEAANYTNNISPHSNDSSNDSNSSTSNHNNNNNNNNTNNYHHQPLESPNKMGLKVAKHNTPNGKIGAEIVPT